MVVQLVNGNCRYSKVSVMADSDSVSSVRPAQRPWVERFFQKRECVTYIPSTKDPNRCGCGRPRGRHVDVETDPIKVPPTGSVKWDVVRHTELTPTDTFGTLEFQGGPHPTKAQYVRLSYDTPPDLILGLFTQHWNLDLPKLLISVHGGIVNFDLQPKLKRVFRKGLLKAANTTGAWIITGGTNTGVMRHVGEAIGERSAKTKNNIVTIGIAPWGIVHNREQIVGKDVVRPYHAIASPKSNYAVLNSNHSYFLLVDNGTVGKYGAEILLRKRLEKFISQQRISTTSSAKGHGIPLVGVVLEGGTNTIRTVLDYVTDNPPVPVVVCDGSGRAADLLAFTHKYAQEDGGETTGSESHLMTNQQKKGPGTMADSLKEQLIITIEKTFQYSREQAEKLYWELMLTVKKKELITIFRMGEGPNQDIDLAILTALLKGQNSSAPDQLSLALSWDRVDIAKSHIFVYGQEWPEGSLEQAMMDALINDRVDFVKLLLQNGVSMQKFLTIQRLEELYNIKKNSNSPFKYLSKKGHPSGHRYTLMDVAYIIDYLMGGAYRANYGRKKFRLVYNAVMKKGHHVSNVVTSVLIPGGVHYQGAFKYPFNELMVWAVLMKRQKMAMCMWHHGEEAMAKALVACRLYKAMAHEAANDEMESDISDELKMFGKEFQSLALELLEHCYQEDDDLTEQLLTYELKNWSNQTCLSLAVSAVHREFMAHPCCQILLTDMWMGGLNMQKNTSLKVILGILLPPLVLTLEFKSKEELKLMPQTVEEHNEEQHDSDSEVSQSRRSSVNDNDVELEMDEHTPAFVSEDTYPAQDPNGRMVPSDNSFMKFRNKKTHLRLRKKVTEFYAAPITKFWLHTMSYIAFLMFFNYVVLVNLYPLPSWQEYCVISYIFTLAIEKVRELIASEPVKLNQKLYVFFGDLWNISDTVAIILFSVGVVLRFQDAKDLKDAGHVIYCVDIIFWYIRILDIFSVSKHLGPYVNMVGKMIVDMINFIVILLIVLMSFGVARQSIRYPGEEPSWRLARDIFFQPYFMLYGEVFAGDIDPECGGPNQEPCVTGQWITPAIMSIYLLVANILLINLLIAVFNSTFNRVNAISRQIWKFQRYSLVIEYELKPLLPPPLIIISHVYFIIKWFKMKCKGKIENYDNGLKLFLNEDMLEKIHDFEEDCMDDLFREKENKQNTSVDSRVKQTAERTESMSLRLDDLNLKENAIKLSLQTVDYRLSKLEDMMLQTATCIDSVQRLLLKFEAPGEPRHHTPVTSPEMGLRETESDIATSFEEGTPTKPKPKYLKRVKFVKAPTTGSASRHYRRQVSAPVVLTQGLVNKGASNFEGVFPNRRPGSGGGKTKTATASLLQRRRAKHLQELSLTPTKEVLDANLPTASLPPVRPESIDAIPHIVIPSDFITTANNAVPPTSAAIDTLANPTLQPSCYTTAEVDTGSHLATTVSQSSGDQPNITPERTVYDATHLAPHHIPSHLAPTSRLITPFTPILTPLQSEYTSITDDIDTSCLLQGSPDSLPDTPHFIYPAYSEGSAFVLPKGGSPEKEAAIRNEATILKNAEETEHEQMEPVIRHRIRQISITETDGISDEMLSELGVSDLVVKDLIAASEKLKAHARVESESSGDINFTADKDAEYLLPQTRTNGTDSVTDLVDTTTYSC